MKDQTRGTPAFLHRYLWPLLALALLAIPILGMWELVRTHRPFSPSVARLFVVWVVIELLAIFGLLTEYLTLRKLFSEAKIARDRLQLAMTSGRSMGWEWDLASGKDHWFGDLQSIFGIQAETWYGPVDDFFRRLHPDDRERVSRAVTEARTAHKPYNAEFRVIHQDGTVHWIRATGSFHYDRKGEPERMLGMAVDITERRVAEEALRSSEERFRRVVEHIGDAVIVDNVAGNVVFANDRFLNLFGLDRAKLHNLRLEDYIAPEYPAEMRDRHDRRMRGELVSTHFEFEGIRPDGQRMWLEADVVPIADQTGRLVGTQSAIRDVTERRLAALALRESEERFRLVANTAPVMIWMAGPDKLCNYFNQQWLDFTGRPLDSELGNGWADGVHPEDMNACLDTYSRAFDRREAFDMQYRLRRHDGEYRWLYDRGVPRFNFDGSFAGYIGSCHDVTDRKLADETLGTLGRRLIDAHEEERTWIARELHDDINQRLALITIELERWKQHLPESAADVGAHIEQAGKRLFEISKDVQALSHRLHSSKLDYLGLTTAARSFCKELSESHKVRVQFSQSEVPANLPHEVSLALFRILQESLQNAVKHSKTHDFEVDLRGGAAEISLTVTDRGVGFDQDHALHSRGLGLISMRERLQLVNGTLAIESKPGHGTTIRASAPLKRDVSRLSATG